MDKKSDYYTSPDNYRDINGYMKTFNYIDHDVKTSISRYSTEMEDSDDLKEYKEQKIKEVLSMPAASVAGMDCYQVLINRSVEGITWNESAVKDLMMTTDHFYFLPSSVWKRTVKETHWFDEMPHEDIMDGKWKTLM